MQTVIMSPEFEVVMLLAVREGLKLVPGVKIQVLQFDNRVELIPVQPASALRGTPRGIDTTIRRDADRL